jgi:bifunctional NMN adenylyltransferase/nudix hydrolase
MQPTQKNADIGIIVGRFQVDQLHPGQIELINYVRSRHNHVIIFLGQSPVPNLRKSPLSIQAREKMIKDLYPDIMVSYIHDVRDDAQWSKILDAKISELGFPGQSVLLYGSRDSFVSYYTGRFPTQVLEGSQEKQWSGTEVRDRIRTTILPTADFRAGVIYQAHAGYPSVIPTVDIACVDKNKEKIILIKKHGEGKLRFPGGFCEPRSKDYEEDAKRELKEETGVDECSHMTYVKSFNVDDWRYRNDPNKIRTILFECEYLWGPVKGADDAAHADWYKISEIDHCDIMDEHNPLWVFYKTFRGFKKNEQ